MPATALATQKIVVTGLEPAFTAANADGHTINNNGRVALYAKNDSLADIDVTVVTAKTIDGLALGDRIVTVPAGKERIIKLDSPELTGSVATVTFEAVADLTVAALEF